MDFLDPFKHLWPDLRKPDIIAHFSNSILLYFYNLHTQLYMLAKFQLRILKASEVTALQSSNNRKIDLWSKHRENELYMLPKVDVTYEWSEVGTQILHHHICHEVRNGKKHQSQTTASTSHEQTATTYNFLGALQPNIFELLLLWRITGYPGFSDALVWDFAD